MAQLPGPGALGLREVSNAESSPRTGSTQIPISEALAPLA